jgi:flagellar biosynthesis protein FliO
MNLKISVEKPSMHRMPRRSARESKAAEFLPAPSSHSSSLQSYTGGRKMEALRNQQVRRVPKPKLPPEPVAPQPSLLSRAFSWLGARAATPKQLRVVETVSLGEKRFAAILHADGRRFLIGGGTAGVSLLAQLDETQESIEDLESLDEMLEPSE